MDQLPFNSGSQASQSDLFFRVTPLSRYLSMFLFIALPFVGGYVGYRLALEKNVVMEGVVQSQRYEDTSVDNINAHNSQAAESNEVATYINNDYGFSFDYPAEYGDLNTDLYPGNKPNNQSLLRIRSEDGETFVAILYGSEYDSGTDTIKSPICSNNKFKTLHELCIEKINARGTSYHEINLDMVYGPEKRFEFFVNKDFSLIIFDREEEKSKSLILDSFRLISNS